jgi:hypothetical protein
MSDSRAGAEVGAEVGAEGAAMPVHRRSLEYEVFDEEETLSVVGRLRDTRPWAYAPHVAVVHDMELRVSVRTDDLTITAAAATMHVFPHTECPGIIGAFGGLVGISVARGYTRQVQERFGGPRGCTHLEQMARSLGPVVIQAVTSRRALAVSRGEADDLLSGAGSPWAMDSCHIWATGGLAEQKLAIGWRPGVGPYPAPPLDWFRSSDDGL